MKNVIRFFMIFSLIAMFSFMGLINNASAQKLFQGYWESETIQSSTMPMQQGKKIEKEKTFFKKGKMKVVDFTNNEIMIFRFDKGLIWTIDTKDKTYEEVTFEQMENSMKNAKAEISKQMQKMSPEEKEMMEKMMGGKMGAMFGGKPLSIEFKSTGQKKTIKGHRCEQVMMYMGDDPMMEFWMSSKYSLGDDFLKIYQKMGLIKGKISGNTKLKGFPIFTKMEMDTGMGKMNVETTTTKIVPSSIPDKEFELPKGYKKIETNMMF